MNALPHNDVGLNCYTIFIFLLLLSLLSWLFSSDKCWLAWCLCICVCCLYYFIAFISFPLLSILHFVRVAIFHTLPTAWPTTIKQQQKHPTEWTKKNNKNVVIVAPAATFLLFNVLDVVGLLIAFSIFYINIFCLLIGELPVRRSFHQIHNDRFLDMLLRLPHLINDISCIR